MRVLVTGGCGFVGANLIELMGRTGGFDVRVLDDESLGQRKDIADLNAKVIVGDLRDRKALDTAMDGVDAIVHLAANTRVIESIEDPRLNFEVNVVGTFELLNAMREHGIKKLVNASTGGAILGEVAPPVHEQMVPHPISPYGASKLAVEGYCDAFAASYGLEITSLRFSNVYGPRSFHKGSVVAAFMKNIFAGKPIVIYGDGEQTRDYVFTEDLCRGVLSALAKTGGGVYQLGTGFGTSINDLVGTLKTVVAPKPVEVRYEPARAGEISFTYCDISLARRALGYDPSTTLKAGLAQTWAWFLDNSTSLGLRS